MIQLTFMLEISKTKIYKSTWIIASILSLNMFWNYQYYSQYISLQSIFNSNNSNPLKHSRSSLHMKTTCTSKTKTNKWDTEQVELEHSNDGHLQVVPVGVIVTEPMSCPLAASWECRPAYHEWTFPCSGCQCTVFKIHKLQQCFI